MHFANSIGRRCSNQRSVGGAERSTLTARELVLAWGSHVKGKPCATHPWQDFLIPVMGHQAVKDRHTCLRSQYAINHSPWIYSQLSHACMHGIRWRLYDNQPYSGRCNQKEDGLSDKSIYPRRCLMSSSIAWTSLAFSRIKGYDLFQKIRYIAFITGHCFIIPSVCG